MNKRIAAILTATVILVSYFGAVLILNVGAATDQASWYRTENGVLTSDNYALYPYLQKSMDIGFSKFGEMINSTTGALGVGLQYPGYESVLTYDQHAGNSRDPFANEYVDVNRWVNGWLINISYSDPMFSGQLAYRNVWAFALFADGLAHGGDWHTLMSAPTLGTGGRQTNKMAATDDMQVLYDGPRSFEALCVTHINDSESGVSWPLADVMLTIIFNKVKKEVIVYKEVKLKLNTKDLEGVVDVEFSNRGEWDLGPYTANSDSLKSYPHFYEIAPGDTCYGKEWSKLGDNLTRAIADTFTGPGTAIAIGYLNASGGNDWYGFQLSHNEPNFNLVSLSEFVFLNGLFQRRTTLNYRMYFDGTKWWVMFNSMLTSSDRVVIDYKVRFAEFLHQYSLAQMISTDGIVESPTSLNKPGSFVAFAAFWPRVSDYTVDGWEWRMQSIKNIQMADSIVEPRIPFVIGEWDFVLDISDQFRGVTVYGITDYHNAQDPQMGAGYNQTVVDREVQYQLDEVFYPWDLYSAINKQTDRWVDFHNVTQTEYDAAILHGTNLAFDLAHYPVQFSSLWDTYCEFPENVEWGGVMKHPGRSAWVFPSTALSASEPYELSVNSTTQRGTITIRALSVPAVGTNIKILYSTYHNATIHPGFVAEDESNVAVNNGTQALTEWFTDTTKENATISTPPLLSSGEITDFFGADHEFNVSYSYHLNLRNNTITTNGTLTLEGDLWFNLTDIKVFKENDAVINVLDLGDGTPNNWQDKVLNGTDYAFINMTKLDMTWRIEAPPNQAIYPGINWDLHIDSANIKLHYCITIDYWRNSTFWTWNETSLFSVTSDIQEHIPGRYEWVVVGRDVTSVDSAGATMVTAALKNKQVEYGNGALDLATFEWGEPSIPYLMNCFGTLPGTRTNYKFDGTNPGGRTSLVDDWCTRYPVSSSNIISVGGPLANVMSYYFNDFTSAFYGLNIDWLGEAFTPYVPWKDAIIAQSCWSKHAYHSNSTMGHAVIATYKDINGTVGLMIWGEGPRDTYFASKFFHEEIIYELQRFPRCATSIIIEIDYTEPKHPTFTVPEVLGTISERMVQDCFMNKGDIHPDC